MWIFFTCFFGPPTINLNFPILRNSLKFDVVCLFFVYVPFLSFEETAIYVLLEQFSVDVYVYALFGVPTFAIAKAALLMLPQ